MFVTDEQGMDKILQSGDGDITITNDVATTEQMEVEHQIGKLLVERLARRITRSATARPACSCSPARC